MNIIIQFEGETNHRKKQRKQKIKRKEKNRKPN